MNKSAAHPTDDSEAKRALDAGGGGTQMDRDQWQRIVDRYDSERKK